MYLFVYNSDSIASETIAKIDYMFHYKRDDIRNIYIHTFIGTEGKSLEVGGKCQQVVKHDSKSNLVSRDSGKGECIK
jgi:hypothetical protein